MAVHVAVAQLLIAAALLLHPGRTSACKLAWNGNAACSPTNCGRLLGNVDNANSPVVTGASMSLSSPGGLNYRFFATLVMGDFAGANSTFRGFYFLDQIRANFVQDCCTACAQRGGCYMFRHFPSRADDIPSASYAMTQEIFGTATVPAGGWPVIYNPPYPPKPLSILNNFDGYDSSGAKGNCILFGLSSYNYSTKTGTPCTAGTPGCFYQPFSKTGAGGVFKVDATTGLISDTDVPTGGPKPGITGRPRSYWGGVCNGEGSVKDDPHFVGGDGVRYDFNGKIGKSFCLLTDASIHVNMVLRGYDDPPNGGWLRRSGLHTWITGLTFLWRDGKGQQHSLLLRAREGPEDARGNGFLGTVSVDGKEAPIPAQVDESVNGEGMTFKLASRGKYGPFDIDKFDLRIAGVFAAKISLRAAHPLLRRPSEAYVHFNVRVEEFTPSEKVHGVLGQTYRLDAARSVKGLEYQLLTNLLHTPMHADGEDGAGYLDGRVEDYVTSDPTAADCKFASAWNGGDVSV